MTKKIFTPQEANKRLPLVKQIVEDILSKGRKLKALGLLEPTSSVRAESQALIDDIETLMLELQELGCSFKDWNFEIGLVDFPALIDEKEVLLCWRSDERSVEWYHGFDDGYIGRKKIPQHLLQ
ncbi:MAG: DUF2203 domain-containing protein [Candidatus Omnitrophota bacterium]